MRAAMSRNPAVSPRRAGGRDLEPVVNGAGGTTANFPRNFSVGQKGIE
jgi:hypothetical protein